MTVLLKRLLIIFWAVWLTVVFVSNVLDAGKALDLLRDNWAFASGNYRFLAETTARYGTPEWLNGFLFLGVLCWEGTAAVLFWFACLHFPGRRLQYWAFTVGLTLWMAFMVADEVFIAYAVEAKHLLLFIGQLATLLAVELLPEEVFPSDRSPSQPGQAHFRRQP